MTENSYGRLSVREFLVDLLGSLVPGILFIFLSLTCLAWPSWGLIREIQKATPLSVRVLDTITAFGTAFRFELILFFLVASYVLGHFFFRQDPKEPDRRGYRRASKRFDPEEKRTWCVRKEPDGTTDIQFPYRYLYEYLRARQLHHLAEIVPWRGEDETTHEKRSKAFINLLKIRLLFHFPERCGQITRNEAHIRLMSSIWYSSRTLLYVAIIAIGIGAAALLVGISNTGGFSPTYLIPMLFGISILLLAAWAKKTIERFIHYQRIREVIYVLETAFCATQPSDSILKNLN